MIFGAQVRQSVTVKLIKFTDCSPSKSKIFRFTTFHFNTSLAVSTYTKIEQQIFKLKQELRSAKSRIKRTYLMEKINILIKFRNSKD